MAKTTAFVKREWVQGFPYNFYGWVLRGTGSQAIDGLCLGKSRSEAMFELSELNKRREAKGLNKINVRPF